MQTTAPTDSTTQPIDPLRRHRLDLEALEDGKWIEIEGDRFLVASYSAKRMAALRASVLAKHGLAADAEVPAHLLDVVQEAIFAEGVLRGVKLSAAPSLQYSHDLGRRIYSDPELAALRLKLQQAAVGDYTKDTVAKAAVLGNC